MKGAVALGAAGLVLALAPSMAPAASLLRIGASDYGGDSSYLSASANASRDFGARYFRKAKWIDITVTASSTVDDYFTSSTTYQDVFVGTVAGSPKVSGNWSLSCRTASYRSSYRSGSFDQYGRSVRLPFRRPESCSLSLYATATEDAEYPDKARSIVFRVVAETM